MRNTDERVALVQLRLKEIRQKKRLRQVQAIGAFSITACLLVIIGISTAMPQMVAEMGEIMGGAVASIFVESGKTGYIFVGVLAFALGVCVTLLSFRLRHKGEEPNDGRTNR